jgi:glycolate oxidase
MMNEPDHAYLCLHEFISEAKRKLNPGVWDYLVGATETETTMMRNRAALDALAFRPRVLRDVATIDTAGRFGGHGITIPVALAPVGGLESFHPEGGVPVAKAATSFGVPIIVSSVSQPGLEQVAEASGNGKKVFQLYVRGDRAWVDEMVRRAVDAGYDMFCLTVDTAIYSRRERDIAKRFVKPWRTRAAGHGFQAALNWDDVKHFKDKHRIPLVLKGIATREDAAIACEHGADVVYVSNHGGRQLDHGRGAIAVLPEVIEAVRGRAKVWVDGGISRGSDVVKAIALGAEMVAIGRLYCYGLAAEGQTGIERLLEILQAEIIEVLGLMGCTSFSGLDRSCLHPVEPLVRPHVHSAFPLLNLGDPGYR